MGGEDQVTPHGTWESPFSFRVAWALKLKGTAYDFIRFFQEVPVIKENLPNRDNLLVLFKRRREFLEASAA